MENNARERRIIIILMLLTIIFTFFGSTLAYWNWQTTEEQKTNVVFSVEQNFMCAADGGGNITTEDVRFAPTDCIDAEYKAKYPDAPARVVNRTVNVTPTLYKDNINISLDLWLDVNEIGTGFTNSQNLNYALTTSPTSCTEGVISSGNFNGKTAGDSVNIFSDIYSSTLTETYYLYIWLDAKETSSSTMNQELYLSLNGSCSNSTGDSSPNAPVLDEGMIPVTLSADGTVTTVSENDSSWYDYESKKWANAVLVSDSSRSTYSGTTGTTVNSSDILAYYVWVPRYKYNIPSPVSCSTISNPTYEKHSSCYQYSVTDEEKTAMAEFWQPIVESEIGLTGYTLALATKDIENGLKNEWVTATIEGAEVPYIPFTEFVAMYNESAGTSLSPVLEFNSENDYIEQSINIMFESANSSMTNSGDYITHPAFWWDDDSDSVVDTGETLAGIWVGKFEATGTADAPTILPNVSSLRSQNVSTQFATSQKFSASSNTYGLSNTTTNAHMMKNSEWGAVAYLSNSRYGTDTEIRINNNSNYTTGCGASTLNGSSTSSCEITYGGASSYPQSTTGNISGVFDINGGAWEYVMGNFANTIGSSGFSAMPEKKYYDLYSSNQFTGNFGTNMSLCTLDTCGGHALNETLTWYNDVAVFVDSGSPWFRRGGYLDVGAGAGAFTAYNDGGSAGSYASWRSVLVVGFGA